MAHHDQPLPSTRRRVDGKKYYDDYNSAPSEAYVDDSWEFQVDQSQVNYDPVGGLGGTEACANCHWFDSPNSCFVVAGEISPTGHSDLWMADPAYTQTPIPVTIVKSLKDGGDPTADDEEWVSYADNEPDCGFDVTEGVAGSRDKLTTKKRNKLPRTAFAWVDAGGKGHLPINDADHVHAAMGRWSQTHFDSTASKAAAKRKIMVAAKKFGIDASGFSGGKDADNAGVAERLLSGLRGLLTSRGEPTGSAHTPVRSGSSPFTVARQKDGRLRFYTAWSNNFIDREGEIFTTAAHKDFVAWATETKEYPELWMWHTKGSKFGQVDWLDTTGDGFVHASGLIDSGKEALAEKLAEEDSGVSHGFIGLQQANLIHWYRSYELSVLPIKNAAVWTTSFNLLGAGKAIEMGFTPEKRKYFQDLGIAEDQIKSWEGQTEGLADALKGLGLESKAADLGIAVAPPPTPEVVAEQTFRTEMMKSMQALTEVVAGLAGSVKTIDERTKDIKSGDAVIAEAMTAANGKAVQASKSDDNVIHDTRTGANSSVPAATKDFFEKTVLGSLLAPPAQA